MYIHDADLFASHIMFRVLGRTSAGKTAHFMIDGLVVRC